MANHNDKAWEFFYRLGAGKLLSTNGDVAISAPPSKTTPPLRKFSTNYSMIFQALMTTLVTIVALVIIASAPVEKKKPNQQQGGKQSPSVTLPANPSP